MKRIIVVHPNGLHVYYGWKLYTEDEAESLVAELNAKWAPTQYRSIDA